MNTTTLTVFARDFSTSIAIAGPPCILDKLVAAAVSAGMTLGVAFDVHLPSGAIAWAWEMR